jgi:hypothetical protein
MVQSIAFVTGYIGTSDTKLPNKSNIYDSYFITNNKHIYNKAKEKGWIAKYVSQIPLRNQSNIRNAIKNTMSAKIMKLFPQQFVDKQYDYIVWSDHKFTPNIDGIEKSIENMNVSMYLHRHPFLNNIIQEYDYSIKWQPRYKLQQIQYISYIKKQIKNRLSTTHARHYQCGLIIYNIKHSHTAKIQQLWANHIQMCGIQDQISFNFVQQIYPNAIGDFEYPISM